MEDCKLVSTPLAVYVKHSLDLLTLNEDEEEHMSHVPYSSVVVSIMYVMVCACPNIS